MPDQFDLVVTTDYPSRTAEFRLRGGHIDTVAVPDFDVDLLGHGYFAQAEALLHDIHDLMGHNDDPAKRQRITPALYEGTAFWELRR